MRTQRRLPTKPSSTENLGREAAGLFFFVMHRQFAQEVREMLLVGALMCLTGVCSAPSLDPQLDPQWNQWKNQFSKTYDQREEGWRRMVWEKNLRIIEAHNAEYLMGKHSFKMGMNQFGDTTNEEFGQLVNGFRAGVGAKGTGGPFYASHCKKVPPAVDWRDHGHVTPVKDQGDCSSCWAFSATGALEAQKFKKTGRLVSMSEQNLVDCSNCQGNKGCRGGHMNYAFQYVIDNNGLDTEAYYPYVGNVTSCGYKKKFRCVKMKSFRNLPRGREDVLMHAVACVGPISAAINASLDSFKFYKSGIYYDETCNNTNPDHAVLVVGYGTQRSIPQDKNYWIVKNSWGTAWGEDGYVRMAKDRNNSCAVTTHASFPEIQ